MNPANDIAVSPADSTVVGTVVTNANLYFFAWLSFGCAVSLTGSMAQEYITLFSTNTNNNPRMSLLEATRKAGRWYALTATTIIMTGTAVRDFQVTSCRDSVEPNADDDEDEEDTNRVAYCRRSRFAIAMGMIGLTMAATMTAYLTKQHMSSTTVRPLTVAAETGVTTLQLVLWCFGVGYITFGKSPGSTIGNLYFSTWISFILAVFLFATSFRELVATRAAAAAAAQQQQQEDSNDAPNNTNGRQGSIMPPQPEFDDM